MMLFLVVTDFTDSVKKSLIMTQDGINYDVYTIVSADNDREKESILGQITSPEISLKSYRQSCHSRYVDALFKL